MTTRNCDHACHRGQRASEAIRNGHFCAGCYDMRCPKSLHLPQPRRNRKVGQLTPITEVER